LGWQIRFPRFPGLLAFNPADLHSAQCRAPKGNAAKEKSDWPMLWPMCGVRVALLDQNPTTVLRGNPTVETRSQPAPMRLSNAYFSILLSRHSYRKFNNIRVPGVAHNPKVVGSNPTPATKESSTYRLRFPNHFPIVPQSEIALPDGPSSLKDYGV